MSLELSRHSGGIIDLYYEDRINGKDRLFRLGTDGLAYEVTYDDDDNEVFTPVNLVDVLRAMAQEAQPCST